MRSRTIAGWTMSPQLWEAWNFRAEANPPAQTGAGQAPSAGQPQAGTSGTAPQAGADESAGADGNLSLEEMKAALAKARREAAGHRARATQLETAQAAADAAKLSDLEKATKKAADLESENTRIKAEAIATLTTAKIERIAAQLGIVDPEVAAQLIKAEDIERDAAGNPTNLETLLKALLKAKPYLAAQAGQQSTGAPMNPASGRGAASLTLEDIKKMTPAQSAARWSEVSKVLAGG